nr:hypothetical protein [Tanacetum cinerariifolium]
MQDTDEEEPAEVEEVLKVVTAAKLMTEVVTTAQPTTIVAQVPKPSAPRRRRGVVIQDSLGDNNISYYAHREKEEEEVIVQEKEIKEKEELKRHLQIVANDDDDVYTEATPLAFKEPKNFSDDFLLNILKIMFEKSSIEASVWKDQKGRYELAKVKSWKLFESYEVHVITLTTTQMFLLVEKKYPLTHFTLEQMLNNMRFEVEECHSAKTTSWNKFSSTMASAIICLATNQKFNFSMYILLSLVKNIEAGVPFYMFPRGGTSFSVVITPLFENMLVSAIKEVGQAQDDVSIPTEPSTSKPYKEHKLNKQQPVAPKVPSPEPSPAPQLPSPSNDLIPDADKDSLKLQELMDLCIRFSNKVLDLESEVIDIKFYFTYKIAKLKDRVHKLEEKNRILKEKSFKSTKVDTATPIEDKEESFKQGRMIADMNDDVKEEPAEMEEVLEVVKAAKLMTEVVTTAQSTTTVSQVPKANAPRKRRGVVIQDPEETAASVIMHTLVEPKDKGKGILIEEPKPLKWQAQIEQDEAFARQLEVELNANINWNDVIEQEIEEEGNKRQGKSIKQETTKKQRMDEEAEELKRHRQIMANDDDDVFTEATTLASKLVKERFETIEPNNFSNDFLLNILKIMFEKPDIEANVWKDQKGRYWLAKQMLDNVRLEVEKENEMSLELLSGGGLIRYQAYGNLYAMTGDDPIACLNKAMAFLTAIVSSRVMLLIIGETMQVDMQGLYNYQGEGHMARQCTQPKRTRNAIWYKDNAMLVKAQEAGQILDEEQLAFLADTGVPDGQVVQTIIPNNAAFQTEDLDTYDSDCDDILNAKAVLMVNIFNYGSDVISKVP